MRLISDQDGMRLDLFLSSQLPGMSRSAAQKLLTQGQVTLNGRPARKSDLVCQDDIVEFTMPDARPVEITPRDIPLDIVYEDEDVLVVNKPKGLVVHPAPGHWDDTLVNALMFHRAGALSGINGELRPGIVHRIDKDTSGLLAVAKNDLAHTVLASQLKDHTMARTYEAVLCGTLKDDAGVVDAPIGRHPTDRKRMAINVRGGRDAVTHYEVIARYPGYTHVRCRLETGRTHQIRVHMASIGHPILGDMVYGRKKPELGQDTQCLHAGVLCFRHPRDGRPILVAAPLPDYFQQVLERLRRRNGPAME